VAGVARWTAEVRKRSPRKGEKTHPFSEKALNEDRYQERRNMPHLIQRGEGQVEGKPQDVKFSFGGEGQERMIRQKKPREKEQKKLVRKLKTIKKRRGTGGGDVLRILNANRRESIARKQQKTGGKER